MGGWGCGQLEEGTLRDLDSSNVEVSRAMPAAQILKCLSNSGQRLPWVGVTARRSLRNCKFTPRLSRRAACINWRVAWRVITPAVCGVGSNYTSDDPTQPCLANQPLLCPAPSNLPHPPLKSQIFVCIVDIKLFLHHQITPQNM